MQMRLVSHDTKHTPTLCFLDNNSSVFNIQHESGGVVSYFLVRRLTSRSSPLPGQAPASSTIAPVSEGITKTEIDNRVERIATGGRGPGGRQKNAALPVPPPPEGILVAGWNPNP